MMSYRSGRLNVCIISWVITPIRGILELQDPLIPAPTAYAWDLIPVLVETQGFGGVATAWDHIRLSEVAFV